MARPQQIETISARAYRSDYAWLRELSLLTKKTMPMVVQEAVLALSYSYPELDQYLSEKLLARRRQDATRRRLEAAIVIDDWPVLAGEAPK